MAYWMVCNNGHYRVIYQLHAGGDGMPVHESSSNIFEFFVETQFVSKYDVINSLQSVL